MRSIGDDARRSRPRYLLTDGMDNLTHTLAGAALGEAGLQRLSGLGMAALTIGANLPDIDVVAVPLGANLTMRRGWTHGPIAMVVLPVLLTGALVLWDRWQTRTGRRPRDRAPVRVGPLLLLSFLGVLSHPALDWLNTYGVRLLMPFSDRWFYGDAIFIIDPWIWLALGAGVALSRRGTRVRGRAVTRPARIAVGVVVAYVALMIAGSRHARREAIAHVTRESGRAPVRVMAGPAMVNPLRRELIVDMGDHYRHGALHWEPSPNLALDSLRIPTHHDHPAVRHARQDPRVQDFLVWSRFPFFRVEEQEDGTRVQLGDVRFLTRGGSWTSVEVRVPHGAAR